MELKNFLLVISFEKLSAIFVESPCRLNKTVVRRCWLGPIFFTLTRNYFEQFTIHVRREATRVKGEGGTFHNELRPKIECPDDPFQWYK